MLKKNLFLIIGFCIPAFLQAQVKHTNIDAIHFPTGVKVAGPGASSVHAIITKERSGIAFYVSAVLTSDGQQEISSIDLPMAIGEPEPALKIIRQRFHWIPNIKAQPDQIIADHVFRSPCIIQTLLHHSIVLIPDVNLIGSNYSTPYYLDLDYSASQLTLHYGIAAYKTEGHVYYARSNKLFPASKELRMAFYLLYLDSTDPAVVLKKTDQFLWRHFAAKYTRDIRPQTISFQRYADTGYQMALKHYWVNAGGGKGGITLSTFYNDSTKTYGGRSFHNDLWFQSWFNNMRTAYGLYSWGKALHREEWIKKAKDVVRLLLSSPSNKGWFPTIYNTEAHSWLPSGVHDGLKDYYMPDNAWTAYWLLRFDKEFGEIPAAKKFLQDFTGAMLRSQHADGSFPSFVSAGNLAADTTLDHSAGSAMGTWFLEEMLLRNEVPKDRRKTCINAVLRADNFLIRDILPNQRFEDFESFFSCSRKPMHYYDSSTAMYNQNTLSLQWCAEALLKGSEIFHDPKMLTHAEYCVNILSLYQQVWNPPFISFYAFGGFGAQNTDAEWNDARQAQFADTYLQFFQETRQKEYLERAVAACRASFALMVLPENKEICPKNYKGTDVNGESFSGSMAENYGHSGFDERSYQSGFHWGTGSALTTAAIFETQLGDIYIDPKYRVAEGINGIVVRSADWAKTIHIKTDRLADLQRKSPAVKFGTASRPAVLIDGQIAQMIR